MNLKDYQRGRNDGLALALKLCKKAAGRLWKRKLKTEV